ncbi:MAG: translation initiation factor IF-2 subunit alpha [Candidatus Bathyarchaeota archaeon]|nr:translation initiation factor IF-2 subunit alpha [Candidatus Bathyarchaeota archaeon]
MGERKPQWPEVGDLVIATVENVADYGAYVNLDEYNKRGLLHVSEISSSWIRNIRDFVREGQKVVLKVTRVNLEKGHIDLSLRRVTKRSKIEKIRQWKQDRKAEALLRGVAEKIGLPNEEVYEKAGALLEEKYELYEGFEKIATEGSEVLTEMGVPKSLAKAFADVAEERIRVKMVKVKGTLEIRCLAPNGFRMIKDVFLNAKKTEKTKDTGIRFYVVAAPKYSVEVSAENYKRAEEVLQKVSQSVITNIVKTGGQGTFRREK